MTKNVLFLSISKAVLVLMVFVSCLVVLSIEMSTINSKKNDVEKLALNQKFEDEELGSVGMYGEEESAVVSDKILADDARVIIVQNYLERYKSPLLPFAETIVSLSDSYGYDYRWIVAIGQQESNLCKKVPKDSYNCWGYGIHSKGTLRFNNYDLALRSFALYLKEEYFDKGYDTPELIMSKYCPHSNGSWAFGVRQFFDEMESGNY